MKQDTIVQFVCFITNMATEEFAAEWEGYAQTLKINKTKAVLYRQIAGSRNSFHYISKFEWPAGDFQFPFINERKPGRFSESGIRALQMGGYITIQQEPVSAEKDDDTTIVAFIHHNETEMGYYYHLPLYKQLNIHEAYYENCNYGHVMEFTVPGKDAELLLQYLDKKHGAVAGLYRTSLLNKVHRLAPSPHL